MAHWFNSTLRRSVFYGAALAAACAFGAAKAEEPIKFGISTAVSGDAAAYGKPFLDAVQAMAEKINTEGGVLGRKLEVVYYDDRGVPDVALQVVKKLAYDDKVHTLQPGSTSGAIFTAMPVGMEAKIPMWGYGLAKDWLVQGKGMIFRSATPDQVMIPTLADFATKKLGIKKVGILHIDTFYGESSKDVFEEAFEAAGGEVTDVVTYQDGARDFSSQLLALSRSKPDAIYIVVQGGALAPALRQIRQFIPPETVILGDNQFYNANLRKEAGDLAKGVYYFTMPMVRQNKDPLVQEWIRFLDEKAGGYQEIQARAVVGMQVLTEAIKRAGTLEAVAVMKEVHRMKDFKTPVGPYTYDPRDGEGLKTGVVLQVKSGADMAADEVLYESTITLPLYKERLDYTEYFGEGYAKELYQFQGISE